ncbi:MAG: ABC transporter ATP-binding protein, partial [Lachnospiraceae bacterium]|nr:ABC transporter ATP-binding protein [Lachnospiraceae bacterium]
MVDTFIEVRNLSHSFGVKKVLDNISFQAEKGAVTGLLGPSGAGKTTLVNLLTGQLKPDTGEIRIGGRETGGGRPGIMMDSFGLYERLSVYENLKIYARIYRVPERRIDELLKKAELSGAGKTIVGRLSKGMRSRVNFCRALLKETDILFLDEPTSGLDPATTEKIHGMMLEEKSGGTTIFLTTHNMHEAERLCDKVILLNEGKIVEDGVPKEICRKYNSENKIEVVLKNGEVHRIRNAGESAGAMG